MRQLQQRWPIAVLLFFGHLPFLMLLWVALAALLTVITAVLALFVDISVSVWDHSAALLRWMALFYGTYLTRELLTTCVMHGRTRRAFTAQATLFVLVASGVLAVLMALGYALEHLIYNLMGWSHTFIDDRLFDSLNIPLIIYSWWGLYAVWTITGAFIGAALRRNDVSPVLAIVLGIVLLSVLGPITGMGDLPFTDRIYDPQTTSVGSAIGLSLLAFAVGAAFTWLLVRNIPIRPRIR